MTDELEKHPEELHRCFGVRVTANGKAFDIDPRYDGDSTIGPQFLSNEDDNKEANKKNHMIGAFVKYEDFIKIMMDKSFKKQGYETNIVNNNCMIDDHP